RQLELCTVSRSHAAESLPHQLKRACANFLAQRAHRAFHFHFLGDDVVAVAAFDRADGDDKRLERIDSTAANRLNRGDALGGYHDRVHAKLRLRAVRLLPTNSY